MSKVFLGVGHGGNDPGAVGNGLLEKNLTLSIAKFTREELERHNVQVLMSRNTDENDPIQDEIRECNNFSPDLAADIHINAGGGDGFEVYHYSKGGKSKVLAENIEEEVIAIKQNSRGLKIRLGNNGKDYYAFIRETKPPAVIVECAFIDNKADIQIIDTLEEQKTFGIAIAKGILKTLNIAYIEPVKPQPTKELWYRAVAGSFLEKTKCQETVNKLKSQGYDAFIALFEK